MAELLDKYRKFSRESTNLNQAKDLIEECEEYHETITALLEFEIEKRDQWCIENFEKATKSRIYEILHIVKDREFSLNASDRSNSFEIIILNHLKEFGFIDEKWKNDEWVYQMLTDFESLPNVDEIYNKIMQE
jgi:hypothetical protein